MMSCQSVQLGGAEPPKTIVNQNQKNITIKTITVRRHTIHLHLQLAARQLGEGLEVVVVFGEDLTA
jgi:hypothetical protein